MHRPNAKAIGTPSSTPAPTRATKKNSRFQLPIAASAVEPVASAPARIPSARATISTSRHPCCASRSSAKASMRPMPASMAAARMLPGQLSAGVSMKAWSPM